MRISPLEAWNSIYTVVGYTKLQLYAESYETRLVRPALSALCTRR